MEITLQEIQQKFEELPENLKWAIMAANIDEHLTTIGQRHGLNIDQLGQLSLETHMVVLGYTPPDNFESSLKGSLNLPDDKNKEIIKEINEQILEQIREKLKSFDETEEKNLPIPEQAEPLEDIEENNDKVEENTQDKEKIIENKKIMESIAFKKLSGSFNSQIKKTEHSLDNISKNKEGGNMVSQQDVKITDDPYRMKPEA